MIFILHTLALISAILATDGEARIITIFTYCDIFTAPHAAAGIQTCVSRVALKINQNL